MCDCDIDLPTVDALGLDHANCMTSTGIDDSITAGQGYLDFAGFWSIPCPHCAERARAALED